jgi:hypothetical protein
MTNQPPRLSPNGTVALALAAERGWYVLPVDGKEPIGELVPHGFKDATTDPAIIAGWYARRPDAGVAIDLERSGVLAVDPDDAAAMAEAHKLGLSPTIIRRSRCDAFLYRRPADCPALRITNRGRSKKLDVLSAGYLVVHGRHPKGHAVYLEGEALAWPPLWPVDWLCEAATKRERVAAVGRPDDTDDGPPVELDEYGMEVWNGSTFKAHPGGAVDRSGSLVKLGRVLYDAGATRRTLLAFLPERDEALGWKKYTDRPDAAEQYARIVTLLEAEGRNPRPIDLGETLTADPSSSGGESPPGCCDGCTCRCCRRGAKLEADNAEFRAILSRQARILGSETLTPAEKIGCIGALNEIASAESRKPGAWHAIYREAIAEKVHISPNTAGKVVTILAEAGAVEKQTDYEAVKVNRSTGEILKDPRPRLVTRVRPRVERADAWAIVAQAKPSRPERNPVAPRCPLHQDTEAELAYVCRTCQLPIDQVPTYAPTANVGFQPAPPLYTKKRDIGPAPPDGPPSVDVSTYCTNPCCIGAEDGKPPPLVVRTLTLGAQLGFPPVRANGGYLRGRAQWERLRDPTMYTHLPGVLEQAEQLERDRGRPLL